MAACGRGDGEPDAVDAQTPPAAIAQPAPGIELSAVTPVDPATSKPAQGPKSHIEMRPPSVRGALSRAVVVRTVRNRIGDIKFCHRHALARRGDLSGSLTLDFRIKADGTLEHVEILGSNLGDDGFHRCILDAVRTVKFPAPRDAGPVRVTYPISFGAAVKPTKGGFLDDTSSTP